MLFNSYEFLVFFPLVVAIYFVIPNRFRWLLLLLASYYFSRFNQNYPRSQYTEESYFLSAYCHYLDSPRSSLDQSNSYLGIQELQLFLDLYPDSDRAGEALELLALLRNKLEEKAYDNALLYYKMRQYEAAIAAFNILLKESPDTKYKEDILYYIMRSYYNYALYSVSLKQEERLQATIDSYNEFVFHFPESDYMKDINTMKQNTLKKLNN